MGEYHLSIQLHFVLRNSDRNQHERCRWRWCCGRSRWRSQRSRNGAPFVTINDSGLCAHRFQGTDQQQINPDGIGQDYSILTNTPSHSRRLPHTTLLKGATSSQTTQDSWIDNNGDGNYSVGSFAAFGLVGDEQGPFPVYVRYCEAILCRGSETGRVHFISDGSVRSTHCMIPNSLLYTLVWYQKTITGNGF